MACQRCGSERIAEVGGKTSDLCFVAVGDKEHDGYVPGDMGIGSGDYIDFDFCLDCGQMQGEFPVPTTELESGNDDAEPEDD